jgi:hypothetical protein
MLFICSSKKKRPDSTVLSTTKELYRTFSKRTDVKNNNEVKIKKEEEECKPGDLIFYLKRLHPTNLVSLFLFISVQQGWSNYLSLFNCCWER